MCWCVVYERLSSQPLNSIRSRTGRAVLSSTRSLARSLARPVSSTVGGTRPAQRSVRASGNNVSFKRRRGTLRRVTRARKATRACTVVKCPVERGARLNSCTAVLYGTPVEPTSRYAASPAWVKVGGGEVAWCVCVREVWTWPSFAFRDGRARRWRRPAAAAVVWRRRSLGAGRGAVWCGAAWCGLPRDVLRFRRAHVRTEDNGVQDRS